MKRPVLETVGSPQISEHLKSPVGLCGPGEINCSDIPLLEAEHRQILQTHGSYVLADADMRMLSTELHRAKRALFLCESVAYVLDYIKTPLAITSTPSAK